MDYKDYLAGTPKSNFFTKGKNDLIQVILSKVKKRNLRILDLGAGVGDEIEVLCKYGDVYAVDINKDALNVIPKNLYFEKRVADVCKLPYKDNFFDMVFSLDVFEHISDDIKSFSEAYRVLKKGGYLVFIVPAFQFLYGNRDRAVEHKRRYDKKVLKKRLSKFRNSKLFYWNFFLFFPIAFLRLIKKKSNAKLETVNPPKFVNFFFYILLKIEKEAIKYKIPLPVGLSIVGFCKK